MRFEFDKRRKGEGWALGFSSYYEGYKQESYFTFYFFYWSWSIVRG